MARINCNVRSCRHNNTQEYCCMLDGITVGNNRTPVAHCCEETECASFEE
jgi:hypothetical protein